MLVASAPLLIAAIFDDQVVRWIVWCGLVGLTLTLLVLIRTRWGQSHPLRNCIFLSLVAHLLLGIYTTTVNIVSGGATPGEGRPLRVSLVGPSDTDAELVGDEHRPAWEQLAAAPIAELDERIPSAPADPLPADVDGPDTPAAREIPAADDLPGAVAPPLVALAPPARASARPAATIEAPPPARVQPAAAAGPELPAALLNEADDSSESTPGRSTPDEASSSFEATPVVDDPALPADSSVAGPAMVKLSGSDPLASPATADMATGQAFEASSDLGGAGSSGQGDVASTAGGNQARAIVAPALKPVQPSADEIPSIYQLRVAPDHTHQALAHGGTQETEAAVVAALRWLAAHQSGDGRWDGQRLEGGRGGAVEGQERQGAGTRADTGITGLALLAFLASGHTQLAGDHRDSVRRGLEYLLSAQASDGNLGGNATLYEKMYCHAMASFALSEAYAMTRDQRLQTAVRRAIGYTLTVQHPSTGGWRYQPGEVGDMSVLGWQFMALKSAELAGISVPTQTREGMIRFIKSVSSGKSGGLAAYRPGHRATRTMTAEALVCRQFMGMPRSNPAADEAGNYLLSELPGDREPNFYYWYYGTLGMYQLQDEHWRRWNEALQHALVGSQRGDGAAAGSWDPDQIWGAYGGRAYSTALGALCLEVYYRFLPFYVEAAGRDRAPAATPESGIRSTQRPSGAGKF